MNNIMRENVDWWQVDLEYKPDFNQCMKRIYAWYEQEIIDRPPIRFHVHNEEYEQAHIFRERSWDSLKERWFDTEFQIDFFEHSIAGKVFNAETLPVYWPNLGPEVFSAFYGSQLQFKEVTSYSIPLVEDYSQVNKVKLDLSNEYFTKIEEMTNLALERCEGKYLVGYTDLHPGMDCVAAWRDPQNLCLDLLLDSDNVKVLMEKSINEFQMIFDHFDAILKEKKQVSVTWMGIPSFGKGHIPSCDFSAMISPEQFEEFCLPILQKEVKPMMHNIFHCDGKGVANHIDSILELTEINAIQWVQGMGQDRPIMQWLPLIKKIQAAGKTIIVDLRLEELDDFMAEVDPKGIFLWIGADQAIQADVIKKVERWR